MPGALHFGPVTETECMALRDRLLELRCRLREEPAAAIEPNRGDVVGKSDDEAQALNEMNQVIASRHNRQKAGVLRQVEQALQRLEQEPEDFGLCLECEEPIAAKRLRLMPYAEYCVACQGKQDGPRGFSRRSLTDYVD